MTFETALIIFVVLFIYFILPEFAWYRKLRGGFWICADSVWSKVDLDTYEKTPRLPGEVYIKGKKK